MSWKRRVVQIQTKKPDVHQIKMIAGGVESVEDLPVIVCDLCNEQLPNGTDAFALTEWMSSREGEPGPWEEEFCLKDNL